ncbi:AbfB domain-containing protein [Streptomyces sp. enrichment culture]|uniref:AbfB domain-containing protein n=1 Tax=Streptomyces sp. enrichment culture TaxID=1795815 RepID=UPI003F571056
MNRTLRAVLALFASVTALVGLTTAFAGTAGAAHLPAGQTTRYTMAAFTNSSESNMYVYDSPDATGYTLRKGPAYTPPGGLIRDPSVLKHTDGFSYLTYTTNWTGNTRFIDTDGSVNVIVSLTSASTATHFTAYKITATNSAPTAWSAPAQLTGIGPNYIDTFVVKVGSTYHAFTRNETTKYIEYATASSLTGPYTFTRTGNWAGFGDWVEGPALVRLDNGGWRISYDGYRAGAYSDSYDDFATWSTSTEVPGLSGVIRHATVLKETVSGGVTLPADTTRSLQSVNFPSRYAMVRSDNPGYIDPVTSSGSTAVKQSAPFTVVSGLADANCYSFRDSAGRHLRHWDHRIRFDSSSGTAVFDKDATYCARPGATAGSVSLESYNSPGRYLRHYNYALRIDLYQNTDTIRADSSFTVVGPWA